MSCCKIVKLLEQSSLLSEQSHGTGWWLLAWITWCTLVFFLLFAWFKPVTMSSDVKVKASGEDESPQAREMRGFFLLLFQTHRLLTLPAPNPGSTAKNFMSCCMFRCPDGRRLLHNLLDYQLPDRQTTICRAAGMCVWVSGQQHKNTTGDRPLTFPLHLWHFSTTLSEKENFLFLELLIDWAGDFLISECILLAFGLIYLCSSIVISGWR